MSEPDVGMREEREARRAASRIDRQVVVRNGVDEEVACRNRAERDVHGRFDFCKPLPFSSSNVPGVFENLDSFQKSSVTIRHCISNTSHFPTQT